MPWATSLPKPPPRSEHAARAAAVCAALAIAQQVAGKAARDALFLSAFDISALPVMLVVSALASITLALASTRWMSHFGPARAVPVSFLVSAGLLIGLWFLTRAAPRAGAVLLYVHVVASGSLLVSGFWSVVSERFDPRSAKRTIGRIAAGGALGGVIGGALTERVAALFGTTATLPMLALLHLLAAAGLRFLVPRNESKRFEIANPRAGARTLRETRYLQNLALLVFLVTLSGTLVDFVLKAAAAAEYRDPEMLLRFFAAFYTGVGVVTFVLQSTLSRLSLERWGLSGTVVTLPLAVLLGGGVAVVLPNLANIAALRGVEAVVRNSMFRSAYELFYTPLAPRDKRGAKALIDVVCDRMGDVAGGALARGALFALPHLLNEALIATAAVLSLLAVLVARRLSRGYVFALERSLVDRAALLDGAEWLDKTTFTTLLSLHGERFRTLLPHAATLAKITRSEDPLAARRRELRSGDPARARRALREPLVAELVPEAIELLADDPVAAHALRALRACADGQADALARAFLDPARPAVVRRRLARVIAAGRGAEATRALIAGLDDSRFDLRFACGRALAKMTDRGETPELDSARVFAVVLREAAVSRAVWRSQQPQEDDQDDAPFAHPALRERASRSLEHVFTLLSLVLPREPLRVAYAALHSDQADFRGTALEYLESILPEAVRERLWPFLEAEQQPHRSAETRRRSREELAAELKRVSETLRARLER
jgi:ATP:ADP antiporter, AAA family